MFQPSAEEENEDENASQTFVMTPSRIMTRIISPPRKSYILHRRYHSEEPNNQSQIALLHSNPREAEFQSFSTKIKEVNFSK